MQRAKYPDYPFYVVYPSGSDRIYSGWEFAEDARDNVKEVMHDSGIKLKVMTHAGWKRKHPHFDPRSWGSWITDEEWRDIVAQCSAKAQDWRQEVGLERNPSKGVKLVAGAGILAATGGLIWFLTRSK